MRRIELGQIFEGCKVSDVTETRRDGRIAQAGGKVACDTALPIERNINPGAVVLQVAAKPAFAKRVAGSLAVKRLRVAGIEKYGINAGEQFRCRYEIFKAFDDDAVV